jgi:2-C-methyl-D-erythritol 4-phosphate cytidylyltransferase
MSLEPAGEAALGPGTAVGLVPTEGRGSLPFALLRGESLVAVASWALGEAGVGLLDFTESWADVQAHEAALVIHDPLCPGTPVSFLAEAVRAAVSGGCVVVGVRPVTDTVVPVDEPAGLVGAPVDRAGLVTVASPVVLPADVVAELGDWPKVRESPSDLVAALRHGHQVVLLEAPPTARRVLDESDLRLLEALSG